MAGATHKTGQASDKQGDSAAPEPSGPPIAPDGDAPSATPKRSKKKKQKAPKVTPAMQQFHRFKKQHPHCVLFFRMGDFYEMFYEDAKLAHRVLGVTLTQRTEGVPMAGVPYHSVEGYLRRMIEAGHRVAVCEQVEDPAQAKGVVQREVTRVVTPGTLTDEAMLEDGAVKPLAAVMFHAAGGGSGDGNDASQQASVAWLDLSTGAFQLARFAVADLEDELARIAPSELLFVETANIEPPPRVQQLIASLNCSHAARPGWQFRHEEAREALCKQFGVTTLDGFGIDGDDPVIGPASAIVHYLLETQRGPEGEAVQRIAHLQPPRLFTRDQHLVIDQTSLRSLEIERTMRSGEVAGSVLGVMQQGGDGPRTAMGKRKLRHWLCYPLSDIASIQARQRVVGALVEDERFRRDLRGLLDEVHDVERISARIAVGRATPRDLVALGGSAQRAIALLTLIAERPAVQPFYERLEAAAERLAAMGDDIVEACVEAPPAHLREGGLIQDGYDAQLDECRALQRDSNTWLAKYQAQLIEATGVTSLKVGYNKVFGYYIELSATNRDKAPDDWTRKQTLKNAERFITPPLKEFESKVLSAKDRAITRELALFEKLCKQAADHVIDLQSFADVASALDTLACFAQRAVRRRYTMPELATDTQLHIEAGRHPVLDELLGEQFVPNEVGLGKGPGAGPSAQGPTLALITGPNMAGKSTYIRQTALITLLAHTGSFVPADRAVVGLCDRIFTRIGASDELHAGQSTFMVEMTETANICHHVTEKSLVVLDEIGRGTSTLDGLSLAWAIAEHLAQRRCRTLFATHYHELTQLADTYEQVTNLNVTVREWQDEIVFLHRIVPGATDRSYGIHVAKIAGLPPAVVQRANELLRQLSVSHSSAQVNVPVGAAGASPKAGAPESPAQMSLFTEYVEHPAVAQLREADVNALTPLQAFDLLRKVKAELEGEGGAGE